MVEINIKEVGLNVAKEWCIKLVAEIVKDYTHEERLQIVEEFMLPLNIKEELKKYDLILQKHNKAKLVWE